MRSIHLRVRQTEILLGQRLALGDVLLLELGQQRNDRGHVSLCPVSPVTSRRDIVKFFAISGREKAQTPQPGYCPVGFGLPELYGISRPRAPGRPPGPASVESADVDVIGDRSPRGTGSDRHATLLHEGVRERRDQQL